MGGGHLDLSTDQLNLDHLVKKAWGIGATLIVFGLIATIMLGALSGGDDGHGGDAASGAAESHGDHHEDHHKGDHSAGHSADESKAGEKDHDSHGHHAYHGYVSHPEAPAQWYHRLLVNATFFLSITIGALFFIIIHHLVRAGWSTSLRRLAEGVSLNFIVLAVIFIPITMTEGLQNLFVWWDTSPDGQAAQDPLVAVKASYLNPEMFRLRVIAYFALWIGMALFFYGNSVKQDSSGDPKISRRMGKMSPVALLLFATSVTFASFDFLMALDAHWFSTMFGVYFFAGCVLSWHAFLALLVIWLQHNGRLQKTVTVEHMQDVGKMVFAFTVFWAYVAFSQYMLYWYANIPEETGWFLRRQEIFSWGAWGFFLVFGHFVVPFLFLLSKHVKRRKTTLAIGASWMLIVHWCDLYYIVMPQLFDGLVFPFHLLDVSLFLTLGGIYLCTTAWFLKRHSLVAVKDPRLPEALAFHNA